MSLEKANNYLKSNMILKAYQELSKDLKGDDFEQAEAVNFFLSEYIENFSCIEELIKENPDWIYDIPKSIITENIIGRDGDKIIAAMVVSGVFNGEADKLEYLTKIMGIEKFVLNKIEKEKNINEFLRGKENSIIKYALYLFQQLKKEEAKKYSIWIVNVTGCAEKKIGISLNFEGSVKVVSDNTKRENIRGIEESGEKVLIFLKQEFNLKENIGVVINIYDLEEGAVIEGQSATMAIYMAILNELSGIYYENCAFIANIDITNGDIKGVDKNGLKIKIEKAIENGYRRVCISKENYGIAMDYEERIEVFSVKNNKEIFVDKRIKIKSEYKKIDTKKGKFNIILFVAIVLIPVIGIILFESNPNREKKLHKKIEKLFLDLEKKNGVVKNSTTLGGIDKNIITVSAVEKTKENRSKEESTKNIDENKQTKNSDKVKRVTFFDYKPITIEYNIIKNKADNSKNEFKVRILTLQRCRVAITKVNNKKEELVFPLNDEFNLIEKEEEQLFPIEEEEWYKSSEGLYYLIIYDESIDLRDSNRYYPYTEKLALPETYSEKEINRTKIKSVGGRGAFINFITK